MATLYNVITGSKIYLRAHHVFGRNREKADTVLASKDISHIHASIRWDGSGWTLTDLSRNGIWVDGVRVEPGKRVDLVAGNTIRLGIPGVETTHHHPHNIQESWIIFSHHPQPPTVITAKPMTFMERLVRFFSRHQTRPHQGNH